MLSWPKFTLQVVMPATDCKRKKPSCGFDAVSKCYGHIISPSLSSATFGICSDNNLSAATRQSLAFMTLWPGDWSCSAGSWHVPNTYLLDGGDSLLCKGQPRFSLSASSSLFFHAWNPFLQLINSLRLSLAFLFKRIFFKASKAKYVFCLFCSFPLCSYFVFWLCWCLCMCLYVNVCNL